MSNKVESSADIGPDVVLGSNTSIWHLAQVREGAVLGDNCVIGRGAYIGSGVIVGDNTKIQNYALVYEPARLISNSEQILGQPAAVPTIAARLYTAREEPPVGLKKIFANRFFKVYEAAPE